MLIAAVATIGFVSYVFRPIVAAGSVGAARRFQLVDFFSLVALWQYALGFVLFMRETGHIMADYSRHVILIPVFLVVMTAVWLGLVSTMSRLGVHRASKRFVAVGLAAPVAIGASIMFFISACAVLFSFAERIHERAFFASVWCMATFIGLLCREGLRWATRLERAALHTDDGTR